MDEHVQLPILLQDEDDDEVEVRDVTICTRVLHLVPDECRQPLLVMVHQVFILLILGKLQVELIPYYTHLPIHEEHLHLIELEHIQQDVM